MSAFINALEKEYNEQYEFGVTENGALGYTTTLNPLIDFNYKLPSYRTNEKDAINDWIQTVKLDQTMELSMRYLFYLRDVRGGLGERNTFRTIVKFLVRVDRFPKELLKYIPTYGRWDDLICLYDENPKYNDAIISIIFNQLKEDGINRKANKPISLLAKWMPSIYTKSAKRELAIKLAHAMHISEKEYRVLLSTLRGYLKVVERSMCANNWSEINYEHVPSKANILYRNAFLKHDEERRRVYLDAVNKGDAKINSSVNFPHEIASKYMNRMYHGYYVQSTTVDDSLEALWKNLPDFDGGSDIMVVADTSGSMWWGGQSSVRAADICFALATYFSERAKGVFKDKVMLFSSQPYLVDMSGCNTLYDKLYQLAEIDDCTNTDIKATFDLILDTAVNNNLKQEELPKALLIISDMEFDACSRSRNNERLFKIIEKSFSDKGYAMPKLIFWNVNSRTNAIPLIQSDTGVALLSGYSANIVKMVLSNKFDPFEIIKEQIYTNRYDVIGNYFKEKEVSENGRN